jgi:predicted dehydrogenase
VVAAGSRDVDRARGFLAEHGTSDARGYGSYEELVADDRVDVVYVASPHGRHLEDARLCLDAGKAVLCEKALTLDAPSGRDLVGHARARGLFLAEAMWMRTNPTIREVLRRVAGGAVGEVGQVRADLGFAADRSVARLWERDLGASALLDIGIYPLTFAHLVLGRPHTVSAAGALHPEGFDVAGGATLVHEGCGPDGVEPVASLTWTQLAQSSDTATIAGTEGRIEIPRRFHHPTSFHLVRGDAVEHVDVEVLGRGYAHEAQEVARCLREGRTESTLLPLEGTLAVQELMDEILVRMGVRRR